MIDFLVDVLIGLLIGFNIGIIFQYLWPRFTDLFVPLFIRNYKGDLTDLSFTDLAIKENCYVIDWSDCPDSELFKLKFRRLVEIEIAICSVNRAIHGFKSGTYVTHGLFQISNDLLAEKHELQEDLFRSKDSNEFAKVSGGGPIK